RCSTARPSALTAHLHPRLDKREGGPVSEDEGWALAGSRVRAAREAKGMSVRELARRVGVSASHVSQVERGIGSFSVPAFYAIARELATSVQRLLATSDAPRADAESNTLDPGGDLVSAGIVQRADARPSIAMDRGPTWGRLTPT